MWSRRLCGHPSGDRDALDIAALSRAVGSIERRRHRARVQRGGWAAASAAPAVAARVEDGRFKPFLVPSHMGNQDHGAPCSKGG